MSLLKFTALLALLSLSTPVFSFTSNQRISHVTTTSKMHSSNRKVTPLFSTEPEQNEMDIPLPEKPSEPEGTQYPIEFPSPLLLGSSMLLAIMGTGSAFDLFTPEPTYGFAYTAVLAAVSLPLALYLFYASILKATAETEIDDKEFMKGRR